MSKKVSNKKWLDYQSKKYQKAKYYNKNRRTYKNSNRRYNVSEKDNKQEKYYYTPSQITKVVPSNFSFIENATETIDFFYDIVNEIKKKKFKNIFFIDSLNVNSVTVDALIYLIAIMQNININYEMQYTFKGNLPKMKSAVQIYQESGFMSYVQSKSKRLPVSTNKMQIISGNKNDPIVTSELCKFAMEKLQKERKEVIPLQKVLIELMSNVYHHAYNKEDIMKNHWYIYAEHYGEFVRFIFLDTGAGIARTVRKNSIEKLQRLAKINASDSDLIFSTLQGDFRTETKEKYRGNGLSGVRELAETDLFRTFTVISGSGQCSLINKTLKKSNYLNKICGTIFIFDIN